MSECNFKPSAENHCAVEYRRVSTVPREQIRASIPLRNGAWHFEPCAVS